MKIHLPLFIASILLSSANGFAQQSKPDTPESKKAAETSKDVSQIFNGKDLKGLKVLSKSYFEDHGKVEVKDGQLLLAAGMPGTGIAVDPKRWKDLPRINYEVRLTAKRVKGTDFFCGLTFPVNKSYCTLILGGWGGGSIGLSNIDSMSAIENETSEFHEFKNGKWYDVHLVVTDKTIKATLKEEGAKETKKLFEIATGEHKFDIWWEQEPARPFGLATWNTSAALKQLTVKKLSTTSPASPKAKKD